MQGPTTAASGSVEAESATPPYTKSQVVPDATVSATMAWPIRGGGAACPTVFSGVHVDVDASNCHRNWEAGQAVPDTAAPPEAEEEAGPHIPPETNTRLLPDWAVTTAAAAA